MSPGITCHHIHEVPLEVVAVVGVELKGLVVLDLAVVGVVAGGVVVCLLACGVHRLLGVGSHVHGAVGAGGIQTEVEVEPQVLEAVQLIIELGVAHEAQGVREVDLVVEEGHRVLSCHSVAVVHGEGAFAVVPPAVAVEAVGVVHGLGRVILHGRADGAGIGEAVVHIHTLSVEVDGQVLVQQHGIEAEGQGLTGEVAGLQGTVLVVVADGCAVRHIELGALADLAAHGHVAFQGLGELEDFLLPVCVGVAEHSVGFAAFAVALGHNLAELVSGEDVQVLGVLAHRAGEVEVHVDGVVELAALLGGDDDDAVGCAGTVDGCRGGVLQHGEGLDVARVDG